jgi:hypothetical protein
VVDRDGVTVQVALRGDKIAIQTRSISATPPARGFRGALFHGHKTDHSERFRALPGTDIARARTISPASWIFRALDFTEAVITQPLLRITAEVNTYGGVALKISG